MRSTLSRRTTRIAGLAGAAALAVLGLTGCIKVDAIVGIGPDATGSGTFTLEFQKEAANFLGITDLASFESQISEGALTEGDELDAFTECVTSENDTGYVYTCTFANTEFTDPEGLWQITKEGEEIVFTMSSPGAGEEAAGAEELLGGASMGGINVTAEFPGPITSIEGTLVEQTSENEAAITASMMDEIAVTIRSEAGSSGPTLSVILVIAVTAGIIVLLIVAVILLVMRRRAGTAPVAITATESVGSVDAAEPGAIDTPASDTPAIEQADAPATERTDEDQPGTNPPT